MKAKAFDIITQNNGRITLKSFAASMDTDLATAKQMLKELMKNYRCSVLVSEQGDLVYDFGPYLWGSRLYSLLDSLKDLAGIAVLLLIAVSFFPAALAVSVSYTLIVMVKYVCWFVARITHGKTGVNQDQDKLDMFQVMAAENVKAGIFSTKKRVINNDKDVFLYPALNCKAIANALLVFAPITIFKRLFSSKHKRFLEYIKLTNGIIVPMEWAFYFGTGIREATDQISKLYVKYNADIRVNDDGVIVFDFSELLYNAPSPAFLTAPFFYFNQKLGSFVPSRDKVAVIFTFLFMLFIASLAAFTLIPFVLPAKLNPFIPNEIMALFNPIQTLSHGIKTVLIVVSATLLAPVVIGMGKRILDDGTLDFLFFAFLFSLMVVFILVLSVSYIPAYKGIVSTLFHVMFEHYYLMFILIVLLGFLVLFPVALLNLFFYFLLKPNKETAFKTALYTYLAVTPEPAVPSNPENAARFLQKELSIETKLSPKSFDMMMVMLDAELSEDGEYFYFPALKDHKHAIITEKPLHIVSEDFVYSSEPGTLNKDGEQQEKEQTGGYIVKPLNQDDEDLIHRISDLSLRLFINEENTEKTDSDAFYSIIESMVKTPIIRFFDSMFMVVFFSFLIFGVVAIAIGSKFLIGLLSAVLFFYVYFNMLVKIYMRSIKEPPLIDGYAGNERFLVPRLLKWIDGVFAEKYSIDRPLVILFADKGGLKLGIWEDEGILDKDNRLIAFIKAHAYEDAKALYTKTLQWLSVRTEPQEWRFAVVSLDMDPENLDEQDPLALYSTNIFTKDDDEYMGTINVYSTGVFNGQTPLGKNMQILHKLLKDLGISSK